jgi:hypothetical protein
MAAFPIKILNARDASQVAEKTILEGIIQASGKLSANLEQERCLCQAVQGFLTFKCHELFGKPG